MKKRFTAVLLGAMALSLTACGEKAAAPAETETAAPETEAVLSPEEVYTAAMAKNNELGSTDMGMVMKMSMTAGEESMDMTMNMDMKADGFGSDDMRCLITSTTEAEGESVEMTMFYTGGYYYMDMMGQKLKYAMDAADMEAQAESQADGMDLDIAWMSEITMEEQGDNKVIKYVGDPEKMYDYVQQTLASSGTSLDGMELTVNEISGEYVINPEGYWTDGTMLMDLELSMEGQSAQMVMDMEMTYNNPGEAPVFEMPSTDGYTEIDASMLENAA